jgi:hypothetical protein
LTQDRTDTRPDGLAHHERARGVGRNYGPTTDHGGQNSAHINGQPMDISDKWFTLDHGGGPIWGSRGREFKSRQPDSKAPSESTFPGERNVSPGRERPPFPVHFRWSWLVGSESMCSGPCTLLGRAQMGADVDIHCVASRGAASTGATPARSMATARVRRTR